MVLTPGKPQNEVVSSYRGDVECNHFLMAMFCSEDDSGLFVDRVELVTSDRLELEWVILWLGRDSQVFDEAGVYKISHCAGVDEGFDFCRIRDLGDVL